VLARDCAATGDRERAAKFALEVERLGGAGAAVWTRDIAARLAASTQRAKRKEAR
jgi:hypothetical protein